MYVSEILLECIVVYVAAVVLCVCLNRKSSSIQTSARWFLPLFHWMKSSKDSEFNKNISDIYIISGSQGETGSVSTLAANIKK